MQPRKMCLGAVCCLVLATGAWGGGGGGKGGAGGPEPATPADFSQRFAAIRTLLASTDFGQREAGQKELDKLPPSLLEVLQARAADESDAEVKARLDMRLDAMAAYRLTHPPPLTLDVKDASLADIVQELNRQLGAPLLFARAPVSDDRFTLTARDKPLAEIIAALNRQSPLAMSAAITIVGGVTTYNLALARGTPGRDFKLADNVAYTMMVSGQPVNGTWRIAVSAFTDPRIHIVRYSQLRLDKITDQDGHSLLDVANPGTGVMSTAARPVSVWSSSAALNPVGGVQSIKQVRGSMVVSVLEKEETVAMDLTRELAPVKTSRGVFTLELPAGGQNMMLHLDPPDGAVAMPDINGAGRTIVTVNALGPDGKSLRTSLASMTVGLHVTMALPAAAGATRLEIRWPEKTRDVVIPVEWNDLAVPPPPAPAAQIPQLR